MDLRLHPSSVAPAEGPEKCGPNRPTPAGFSCNNAEGRRGARDGGVGRVRAPAGRLRLLRQIGDELVPGVEHQLPVQLDNGLNGTKVDERPLDPRRSHSNRFHPSW